MTRSYDHIKIWLELTIQLSKKCGMQEYQIVSFQRCWEMKLTLRYIWFKLLYDLKTSMHFKIHEILDRQQLIIVSKVDSQLNKKSKEMSGIHSWTKRDETAEVIFVTSPNKLFLIKRIFDLMSFLATSTMAASKQFSNLRIFKIWKSSPFRTFLEELISCSSLLFHQSIINTIDPLPQILLWICWEIFYCKIKLSLIYLV